jgi:hypothetical protein
MARRNGRRQAETRFLSIVRIVRSQLAFGLREAHLSGFWRQFVGLFVGFLGLPDKDRTRSLNKLDAKCRVCRVFMGVESPRGFGGRKKALGGGAQR